MNRTVCVLLALVGWASAGLAAEKPFQPETIVALERAALDKWAKGDPSGYLDAYARDVTYFDPSQPRRVDGLDAMKALLAPMAGKFKLDRYEMIAPRVYQDGNVAVLSYNLITYGTQADGTRLVVRWNSTAAYAVVDGRWRIVHSHWSNTNPRGP